VWAREYFVPWVVRRLRHQSSGDGITAKRPTPGPVFGPGMPLGSGEAAGLGAAGLGAAGLESDRK